MGGFRPPCVPCRAVIRSRVRSAAGGDCGSFRCLRTNPFVRRRGWGKREDGRVDSVGVKESLLGRVVEAVAPPAHPLPGSRLPANGGRDEPERHPSPGRASRSDVPKGRWPLRTRARPFWMSRSVSARPHASRNLGDIRSRDGLDQNSRPNYAVMRTRV